MTRMPSPSTGYCLAALAGLSALLLSPPVLAQLEDISGIEIGNPVEVFFADKWLPATVVELHNGYLSATFYDERQYPTTLTESFQPIFLRLPEDQDPMQQVGQPEPVPVVPDAPAPGVEQHAAAHARREARETENPAQQVPASPVDFAGDWILRSPGVAYIQRTYEEDRHRNETTRTDWLVAGSGASGMGAVRISRDGTYRMQFLNEKWEGNWWLSDDPRGGIHLEHPAGANASWHLFVAAEDGQARALCATCTGETYQKMERIPAELAERLVAPSDASLMVGQWDLWFQKWESGFVEIKADGSYRLDADGQKAEGLWGIDGESIRFPGAFGRDGWFKLRNGSPDEAALVGAVSEYRALRR